MLRFSVIVLLCSIRPLPSYSQNTNLLIKGDDYRYDSGPRWNTPTCSYGLFQSPIIIKTHTAITNNSTLVSLQNYNKNVSVMNTSFAHDTVSFKMDPTANQSLISEKLDGTNKSEYYLQSLHFHWNCTEHQIDKSRFNMELHFVHYLREAGSFSKALTVEGGLSVLAVLFTEVDHDNEELNVLLDMIHSESKNTRFTIGSLLPENFSVYQYYGSLTTPNCNENVLWNVVDELKTISRRQILRLVEAQNNSIPMNCRRLQPQNDRNIYTVAARVTTTSTDNASNTSSGFILCAINMLILNYLSKIMTNCK